MLFWNISFEYDLAGAEGEQGGVRAEGDQGGGRTNGDRGGISKREGCSEKCVKRTLNMQRTKHQL